MEQMDLDEIVLVFREDLSAIATEMRFAEFEALINQSATLEAFAASVVRAAYVAVGRGLSVRAAVLFLLKVDEAGRIDPHFNVPLRYLARQAGAGPDIGTGRRVRLACRGMCPVPWHSTNLWEPPANLDAHPLLVVQKAVWRNKLKLKALNGQFGPAEAPEFIGLEDYKKDLEQRLDQTIGDDGRVNLTNLIQQHNVQLDKLRRHHRDELEQQQQAYLEQLRSARDEIHKLKAALRHEQGRNRRLQELLRGEY
jgi:hypothetical protein